MTTTNSLLARALLIAALPLSAQDLQLGLERQSPRSLDIHPPSGFLRLDSASSWAPSIRGGWDIWQPFDRQVLELSGSLRLPSERQLTYRNSVGGSGDVAARLRLGAQSALGALYRFEGPFGLPLEAGLGLEARHETYAIKDGGLESSGSLNRFWARGVVRHRFHEDLSGPFIALEVGVPLKSASTPSGVDYLLDLDHLGSSPNPGTAAKAHASTCAITLAFGYRFGRRPMPTAQSHFENPEQPLLPILEATRPLPDLQPSRPEPTNKPTPSLPQTIVLDEASLHFALDRSELPPQGIEVLKAWAERLKALPRVPVIHVSGHTDSTGNRPHNLRLSKARAQAVADVLESEGLNVSAIEGFAWDQPLDSNETLEGRARNRRVEIHLEGQGFEVKGRSDSELVTESCVPLKNTTNALSRRAKPGKKPH